MMRTEAKPLLAELVMAGKIPGMTGPQLLAALTRSRELCLPVRFPVIFCERCGGQLVTHWYAANPITNLELLCIFCSRNAEQEGAVVHTLVEVVRV